MASYKLTDAEIEFISEAAFNHTRDYGYAIVTINPEINMNTMCYDGIIDYRDHDERLPFQIPYTHRHSALKYFEFPTPDVAFGIAGLAPTHDIDTVYTVGSGAKVWAYVDREPIKPGYMVATTGETTANDAWPSDDDRSWRIGSVTLNHTPENCCKYCGTKLNIQVGHCFHCAAPIKGDNEG